MSMPAMFLRGCSMHRPGLQHPAAPTCGELVAELGVDVGWQPQLQPRRGRHSFLCESLPVLSSFGRADQRQRDFEL